MNTYKCNGKCQKIIEEPFEYSNLEERVCCDIPFWYEPKQLEYMKALFPNQLTKDYAMYLHDMVDYTAKRKVVDENKQYLLRFD